MRYKCFGEYKRDFTLLDIHTKFARLGKNQHHWCCEGETKITPSRLVRQVKLRDEFFNITLKMKQASED